MPVLLIACLVFGALSVVAFLPGALVIAGFLLVVPMLILGFAPDAFALCLALLIGRLLAGGEQPLRSRLFWVPVAVLAACSFGAASYFNHDLQRQVRALQQGDVPLRTPLPRFHHLALRLVGQAGYRAPVAAEGAPHRRRHAQTAEERRREFFEQAGLCEDTCLDLLYGGAVDSLLVSAVVPDQSDTPPAASDAATRFHVERLAECPPVLFRIGPQTMTFAWARAHQVRHMEFVAPALQRMVEGECLVPEPATLADADAIVQINKLVLPLASQLNRPSAKNILHLATAPVSASRTSIYVLDNGSYAETYRRTSVLSFPLWPLLVCIPVATGEGGIGISEGFPRLERTDRDYRIADALKTALGVDVPNLTVRDR